MRIARMTAASHAGTVWTSLLVIHRWKNRRKWTDSTANSWLYLLICSSTILPQSVKHLTCQTQLLVATANNHSLQITSTNNKPSVTFDTVLAIVMLLSFFPIFDSRMCTDQMCINQIRVQKNPFFLKKSPTQWVFWTSRKK